MRSRVLSRQVAAERERSLAAERGLTTFPL